MAESETRHIITIDFDINPATEKQKLLEQQAAELARRIGQMGETAFAPWVEGAGGIVASLSLAVEQANRLTLSLNQAASAARQVQVAPLGGGTQAGGAIEVASGGSAPRFSQPGNGLIDLANAGSSARLLEQMAQEATTRDPLASGRLVLAQQGSSQRMLEQIFQQEAAAAQRIDDLISAGGFRPGGILERYGGRPPTISGGAGFGGLPEFNKSINNYDLDQIVREQEARQAERATAIARVEAMRAKMDAEDFSYNPPPNVTVPTATLSGGAGIVLTPQLLAQYPQFAQTIAQATANLPPPPPPPSAFFPPGAPPPPPPPGAAAAFAGLGGIPPPGSGAPGGPAGSGGPLDPAALATRFASSLIVYGLLFQGLSLASEGMKKLAEDSMLAQESQALLQFTTGESATQMGVLEQSTLRASVALGAMPSQTLPALVEASRVAKEPEQAQGLTTQAAALSRFTGQDQVASVDQLIRYQRAWGQELGQNSDLLDLVAEAAKNTIIPLDQFADTMVRLASLGKESNLSSREMAGILAGISQAAGNIDSSKVETLVEAISGLAARSGDIGKLNQLGIGTVDVDTGQALTFAQQLEEIHSKWNTLNDDQKRNAEIALVGRRNLGEIAGVFNNWDQYVGAQENMNGALGTANDLLKTQDVTLGQIINKLSAAVQVEWIRQTDDKLHETTAEFGLFTQMMEDLRNSPGLSPLVQQALQLDAAFSHMVGLPPIKVNAFDQINPQIEALERLRTARDNQPGGIGAFVTNPLAERVAGDSGIGGGVQPPSFQTTLLSSAQLNETLKVSVALAEQYRASVVKSGSDTTEIDKSWAKTTVAIRTADGVMHLLTGKQAEFLSQAESITKEISKWSPPQLQNVNQTGAEFSQNLQLANQLAQQYVAQLAQSNLPASAQADIMKQLNEEWSKTITFVRLADGSIQTVTGSTAAFLSQAEGVAAAWKQAQEEAAKLAEIHPSIQTMPELNANTAAQLQGYLTQYENLLRQQGVTQTPQRFDIFGQGGFEAQFYTSSEAMTLAMALLNESIKDNTKVQSDVLRGHYNIPSSYGYQAPTVQQYYAKTGSDQPGPVNYPWMFGGSAVGPDGQPRLGSVATGAQQYNTSFGAPIAAALLPVTQAQLASAAAFNASTTAFTVSTTTFGTAVGQFGKFAGALVGMLTASGTASTIPEGVGAGPADKFGFGVGGRIGPLTPPDVLGGVNALQLQGRVPGAASPLPSGLNVLGDSGPQTVTGVAQVQVNTQLTAAQVTRLANQTPGNLASVNTSILAGNLLLTQINNNLIKLNVLMAVPPTIVVDAGVNIGSGLGVTGAAGGPPPSTLAGLALGGALG